MTFDLCTSDIRVVVNQRTLRGRNVEFGDHVTTGIPQCGCVVACLAWDSQCKESPIQSLLSAETHVGFATMLAVRKMGKR
jgi:hypothetical protein